MRNTLLFTLAVFLAVVAGGTAIAWFLQAHNVKKSIEQSIAAINEKQPVITYDAIETSGFPTKVRVSIVRPKISGRFDLLIAAAMQAAGTPLPQPLPEWNETIALDGALTFSINAFSSRTSMDVEGNWNASGQAGSQTLNAQTQGAGVSSCTLELTHAGGAFATLWDFQALTRGPNIVRDFRLLDCALSPYTMVDPANQQLLVSSGGGRIYISSQPQGEQAQLRFYAKAVDAEITPAGDALFAVYGKAFSQTHFTQRMSLYGKQNIEIDFSYNGPSEWKTGIGAAPLDVNLAVFNIANAAYTATGRLRVTSATVNGQRTARFYLNTESTATEAYDAIMQDISRELARNLLAGTDPKLAIVQPLSYTENDLYEIIYPAMPNVHSLGKITAAADASYNGNADFSAGDATLSTLNLSAAPYGITGSGSAKLTQGQLFPAASLALACARCPLLIDDMAAYSRRLQKLIALFNPPPAASVAISPEIAAAIKSFLIALAQPADPAAAAFNYTIISNGTGDVTINGRHLNEVMTLYSQTVAPALQPKKQ